MSSKEENDAMTPWPAVSWEERPWEAMPDHGESRRARLRARGPYNAAVPPFIADLALPMLSPETLTAAEDAMTELARFDGEHGSTTAPFAAILLRSESASSSEIEQLTAQPKTIALAELGFKSGSNARRIVGNTSAMEAAIALSADLGEEAIIAMQKALLVDTHPEYTGQWRDQQVWIGGGAANSPHSASFVPPHADRVPALMADLVAFAQRLDLPVMAQLAIAHAQFETIHPVPDGNGRTGRALRSNPPAERECLQLRDRATDRSTEDHCARGTRFQERIQCAPDRWEHQSDGGRYRLIC